jgi:hypothetical protein
LSDIVKRRSLRVLHVKKFDDLNQGDLNQGDLNKAQVRILLLTRGAHSPSVRNMIGFVKSGS